ncbi:MAG TPA: glycosyltransferase, partial [Fimbriimonadaceae bacterium]|nr:glycosyltransferase [Fimbriimonadaceae bacterium]
MPNEQAAKFEIATCIVVHDDHYFLGDVIRAFAPYGPVYTPVSKRAWNGSTGCWERAAEVAEAAGAKVILCDHPDESEHRRAALAAMREMYERGEIPGPHIFIPDGDEIPEARLLEALAAIAEKDLADVVRVKMRTFWRDAAHQILPPEALAPILMLNCQTSQHGHIREYSGERTITLEDCHGGLMHLSYAGPDSRILRKISTWGHRDEVGREWYRRVWKGWAADPLIRQLHPTHPAVYGAVCQVVPPKELEHLPRWRENVVEPPANWPKVSVVIPLYGGPDELRQCLDSLAKCRDLLHETIVVDDASPDDAAAVAAEFDFVTLLRNDANLGFGATCNVGYAHSSGEVILFLNSDTISPRAGIVRLVEGLMEGGTVGAAGPVSNCVGYHQLVEPTYATLDSLDLFAEDLALSARPDQDVEILVGFALAVRRSVLDEVGPFDVSIGKCLYEDTELCYRISRAGYRLKMVGRAYIHHWGSRTLERSVPDSTRLLTENGEKFRHKWRLDEETGFASRLPGFTGRSGLVEFNKERKPEKLLAEIARLREEADISLCMIVRNEERVLANCLESIKPFVNQVVVVDTGSTDRTVEIAQEYADVLVEIEWPNSFAEARNESLKYAEGRWVLWLDADDYVPFATGEELLRAALNAPDHVAGFMARIQFVEEGEGSGTRVDHMKLLRRTPDLRFVGHIHEQCLESVRKH